MCLTGGYFSSLIQVEKNTKLYQVKDMAHETTFIKVKLLVGVF